MSSRNGHSRLAAGALAVAFLVLWAAPSDAYRLWQWPYTGRTYYAYPVTCTDPGGFVHWTVGNTKWYHNTSGQGAGKAAALYNAMNVWTFVTADNHSQTYAGTTTAGFATDGRNTLSWGTGQGCSGSCLALTAVVLLSGQVITESDVTFNSAYTWNTDGSDYDTWAVAAHELGHGLGLFHTEVTSTPHPTMYVPYFGSSGRTLEPDDVAALQCMQNRYPPTVNCIADGGVDDTLYNTACCSGVAVHNSTYCINPADWGTTWASCYQICGTPLVGGCVPSGGIDDTLYSTSCCSGAAVPGSTRCLNPADYNNGWTTCIQTCQ